MAAPKLTSYEKSLVSSGKKTEKKATKKREEKRKGEVWFGKGAMYASAFGTQKLLGGVTVPGVNFPVQFALGGTVLLLEATGMVGKTLPGRMVAAAADGAIAGQLGVIGFNTRAPLFGGG